LPVYFIVEFKVRRIQNQLNGIQELVFWQGSMILYQTLSAVYDSQSHLLEHWWKVKSHPKRQDQSHLECEWL